MADKKTARRGDINKKVAGAHEWGIHNKDGVQPGALSGVTSAERTAKRQDKLRQVIEEKWQRKSSY